MSKANEYVCEFLENGEDIPIGALINYMLEEFPEGNFLYNCYRYIKETYNDNERWTIDYIIEQAYSTFRYEVLKWCGCGDVEMSNRTLLHVLESIYNEPEGKKYLDYMEQYFGITSVYDNPLLLLVAYNLDAVGLTEHGSSIGGAWLTTKGQVCKWLLRKLDEKGDLDV